MSKPTKKPADTAIAISADDPILTGAKIHFEATAEAVRKSCAEALITGMHLIALHARSNAQGSRNDHLNPAVGFDADLERIGIPKTTAYRWMNACRNALVRCTLIFADDELALPTFGSPKWHIWERELVKLSAGMSLSRLMLGTMKASTEEHRFDELLTMEEDGSSRAADLLAGVADGRYTLAAAVKALGSQEAYDKLRREGAEKLRKDPVYLDYDPISKRPVGLIPKAFVTLHNGFQHWDDYDPDARADMKRQWLEVVKTAPRELTDLLKKTNA